MFVVLRRKDQSNAYFPRGVDPTVSPSEYVERLDQVELFKIELTSEGIVSAPPMPLNGMWEMFQVQVTLR